MGGMGIYIYMNRRGRAGTQIKQRGGKCGEGGNGRRSVFSVSRIQNNQVDHHPHTRTSMARQRGWARVPVHVKRRRGRPPRVEQLRGQGRLRWWVERLRGQGPLRWWRRQEAPPQVLDRLHRHVRPHLPLQIAPNPAHQLVLSCGKGARQGGRGMGEMGKGKRGVVRGGGSDQGFRSWAWSSLSTYAHWGLGTREGEGRAGRTPRRRWGKGCGEGCGARVEWDGLGHAAPLGAMGASSPSTLPVWA